jgi:hypothetical protein
MDWDTVSDQEIMDQLRSAELAERLEQSEEWKLVREAIKRVYEKHQKLLQSADPTETELIMNLQVICKMYDEAFLPQLIKNFQNIGEFAYQEAKRRSILDRFLEKFK